ncbi:hypothetical protein BGX28_003786 [Mortierella sp. GBA30]|nr:hypothetical protein BGX28_003786 [Mortierella sp. GBA30]
MAPPQFKVIIAGGGIAGLSLGVMLERAGIDYLILEAASQVHPLGGIVYLGAPVLRAFEQLGLLDDLFRQSNVMTGVTLMDHKLNKVSRINADFSKDRYGYHTLTIVRPKLYDILLSRIPAYKILFGKRVASTSQINDGVRVRCEDNSTYDGDILVAADGGSSPIRKAIYDQIQMRSKKLQYPADYAKPKLDQRCVIGVSEPMSVSQFPVLASKNCEMMLVMPKESNCIVWFVPMAEKRIGWGITSPLPSTIDSTTVSANSSLRGSRMSFESSTFDGTPSSTSSPGRGRSFSSASATSFNPHSATSAPYTGNYVDNFVMNNSSTYSVSNNSNSQFSSRSLKKRHSFGRLSKYSSSSSGSQKSSFDFQQYPSVLRTNDARDLDLDELPIERIWNKLDEKYTIEDSIRKQPCPYGGVLGDIIDSTSRKMITTVVVEEKFYHTWHLERTVLMGDGKFWTLEGQKAQAV